MKYLYIVLIVLAILLIALVIAAAVFFNLFLTRREEKSKKSKKTEKKPDQSQKPDPQAEFWKRKEAETDRAILYVNSLPCEHPELKSYDGLTLRATFIPAPAPTDKCVLCIHGYHCSGMREYAIFVAFYRGLGYNILLPDDRAHGKSDGRYIGFGRLDRLDCIDWCRYLVARFGTNAEIMLHGISMGAATVLNASCDNLPKQVKGIVSDCAFSSMNEQMALQLRVRFHLPSFPLLNLTSLVCLISAGYSFSQCSPVKAVTGAKVPILFIHGLADDFVPTWMCDKLYDACTARKDVWLCDGAYHAGSYLTNKPEYEKRVTAFARSIGM